MKRFASIRTLAASTLVSSFCLAQGPGGGNLNPGILTNRESIERFQDLRVGLSIHWGPSSLGGKEIGWSRGKEIPKDAYDAFYRSFNPAGFNAGEWVRLAKDGGMKYVILTCKHHDGFCLWPSAHSDYDITATPFRRDIVGELAGACREGGLVWGSYYSIIDWYHPDYQPYGPGGPGDLFPRSGDTPNFERYLIYMKSQLRELVSEYGAEIIQLDGEWDPTWNHSSGSDLYLYLRKLNDRVLVNNRTDVGRSHPDPRTGAWDWSTYAGDFEERERMVDWVKKESNVFGRSVTPWQAWVTIDQAQWSWNETPRLLSADEVIADLVKTVGDGGNYLINLGPRPDGTFHPDQAAVVRRAGEWVKRHEDGIYGTRGGPFSVEGRYTSTVKGTTVYLFVLDGALEEVRLDAAGLKIRKALHYNGDAVKYGTKNDSLTLKIPVQKGEKIRAFKILTG